MDWSSIMRALLRSVMRGCDLVNRCFMMDRLVVDHLVKSVGMFTMVDVSLMKIVDLTLRVMLVEMSTVGL